MRVPDVLHLARAYLVPGRTARVSSHLVRMAPHRPASMTAPHHPSAQAESGLVTSHISLTQKYF